MADSPTSRRRPPFPLLHPDKAPASLEAKGQERFAFATPAAREAWYRAAYNQAVNAESWASGDPMDDQTRQAIELGIAGATAPYYKGPDDRYYFHNARTMEDASTRAHRAEHVAGKTMDQIAAAVEKQQAMPGADEYVAMRVGRRPEAIPVSASSALPANDNITTGGVAKSAAPANDNRPRTPRPISLQAPVEPSGITQPAATPPVINGRFAGMAKAAAGPQVTAADFLQAADDYIRLGAVGLTGGYADNVSAGLNAFFGMLGGENLAAAYAANLAEERQRTDAARDRRGAAGTLVEMAPGFVPGIGDVSGLLADFRDFQENGHQWTAADWALVAAGLIPGAPNRRTVKAGKNLLDEGIKKDDIAQSLLSRIENRKADVLTVSEANRLGGEHKGLIYIAETLPRNARARQHQAGTSGAFSDIRTQKFASAALRYENPNKRGRNFIKFEVSGLSEDGKSIELVDAKTKLAIWSKGPQQTVLRTLERTKEALLQNPGYKVLYEFDDEIAAQQARLFIRKHNFHHYVGTRVRKP
jgi:hypothetical protein